MNLRTSLGLLMAASLLPAAVGCAVAVQEPTQAGFQAAIAYAGVVALFTFPITFLVGLPLLHLYRAKQWLAWYHFALGGSLLGLLPLGVIALFGQLPLHLPFMLQFIGAASAVVLWAVVERTAPEGK